MNKKSYLFREETKEKLEEIMSFALDINYIKEFKLLEGGMFNTTYCITTKNNHKYVLRLGPVQDYRILNFEKNLMRAEEFVYKKLNDMDSNVPLPKVIYTDTSRKIIDRDFMIIEHVNGVALSSCNLPEEVKKEIFQEVGKYLSIIHQNKNKEFGHISQIISGNGCNSWRGYIENFLSDILKSCAGYDIFTKNQEKEILFVFKKYGYLLEEIEEGHLIHGDIWDGNILISQDNKIALIIDMDRSLYGDIDFEFATEWIPLESTARGYGLNIDEYYKADRILRRKIYQICNNLMVAYISLVEYNDLQQYENSKKEALKLVTTLALK